MRGAAACPLGSITRPAAFFLGRLHVQVGGFAGPPDLSSMILPWPVLIAVAVLWPILFATFSVYDGRRNGNIWLELRNVFSAILFSLLALAGFLFLTYRETSRASS